MFIFPNPFPPGISKSHFPRAQREFPRHAPERLLLGKVLNTVPQPTITHPLPHTGSHCSLFLVFFPSFATRQSYWKISFPNHNSPTRDCSIRLAHCSAEPSAITLRRLSSAIKNEKPSSLSVEISFRLANSGGTTLQARGRGGMGDKN